MCLRASKKEMNAGFSSHISTVIPRRSTQRSRCENCNTVHRLSDPGVIWVSRWLLTPTREIGSEYVNTYNEALSQVFNCNTNVQVGYIWQIYYSTLYGSKSTQKEESQRVQRILQCVCKMITQDRRELLSEGANDVNNRDQAFTRGLGVMLLELQAATSRHTVSATMAHLIISLGETRFQFYRLC
jgi:hypothetical protein